METVKCCEKLETFVEEEYEFCIKFKPPKVCILNDGGHGGITPIDFCPFCGKKIEIIDDSLCTTPLKFLE